MEALHALIASIMGYVSAPGLALIVLFVGAGLVMFEAQKRPDFDTGNFLKNEAGKESVANLGALIAIVLSGWCLIYLVTKVTDFDADTFVTIYTLHLAVWSGTKVAEKLVDAVVARWTGKSGTIEAPPKQE